MNTGASLNIVHGKRPSLFNTIDTLVLCTVILVKPVNILHQADSHNINEKDQNSDHTLDNCQKGSIPHILCEKGRQKIRQKNENTDCKSHRDHRGNSHQNTLALSAGHFIQCLVKLRLSGFLILVKGCRIVECLHAKPKGINKIKHTSDKRNLRDLFPLETSLKYTDVHFDLSIRFTDCHCVVILVLHHDTFQNSLTTDSTVMSFLFLHTLYLISL